MTLQVSLLSSFLSGADTLAAVVMLLCKSVDVYFVVYMSVCVQCERWPRVKLVTVAKCTLSSHIIVS